MHHFIYTCDTISSCFFRNGTWAMQISTSAVVQVVVLTKTPSEALLRVSPHNILLNVVMRVVRGDRKGTELVSGETVPADLREG
jgi:hypothetical protein